MSDRTKQLVGIRWHSPQLLYFVKIRSHREANSGDKFLVLRRRILPSALISSLSNPFFLFKKKNRTQILNKPNIKIIETKQ